MYGEKFLRLWLWHSLVKLLCTKNYENPSIFVKVTAKKSVAPFFWTRCSSTWSSGAEKIWSSWKNSRYAILPSMGLLAPDHLRQDICSPGTNRIITLYRIRIFGWMDYYYAVLAAALFFIPSLWVANVCAVTLLHISTYFHVKVFINACMCLVFYIRCVQFGFILS